MSEDRSLYSAAKRVARPIAMSAGGRLTLPVEAREALGIQGETQFQVEVVPGGLLLREAITVPSEDAWAYTPEYRAHVEQARRDHAEGRTRTMTVEELERLAKIPPTQGVSPRSQPLRKLIFTDIFLADFAGPKSPFSAAERKKFIKALQLLDSDERHPLLNVHQLSGDRRGQWAAKADDELRLTFERLADGRKLMLSCTHHYS